MKPMNRFIIALISFQFLILEISAQPLRWGEKYCWGCRRYMDPVEATYDAIRYGYIDNINYPDSYALPLNYYFNNRLVRRSDLINIEYMQNCIRFTNRCSP